MAVRPIQKATANDQPGKDHEWRGRHAEYLERCIGTSEQESPIPNIVKTECDQNDRHGGENNTHDVDFHGGIRFGILEFEAEQQNRAGMDDEQGKGQSPVDHCQKTDEHEGQHPRNRAGRAKPTNGLGLLPTAIVVGDQHHERRHQTGGTQARQTLRGEHDFGRRADDHQ